MGTVAAGGLLSVEDFGKQLILTGDLDPVYIAAAGACMPLEQRSRWLIAYWCFYHVGAASLLSESSDQFWDAMLVAADNTLMAPGGGRWPRASERRYFRGPKCVEAVRCLAKEYPDPTYMVDRLRWQVTHTGVMREVQRWPLFGPWIAFKAADMMERVDGAAISFSDDLLTFYAEPRAGLELSAVMRGTLLLTELNYLLSYFSVHCAPPAGFGPVQLWPKRRLCNVQEVETILCKWKSHRAGRYMIGKDIREVRHALAGWGRTAQRLLAACPQEVA